MRIFILLLFISFNTFSQSLSYSDIMSISDIKTFKKVMLENYYSKMIETDRKTTYAYNPRKFGDGDDDFVSGFYGTYYSDGHFEFQISLQIEGESDIVTPSNDPSGYYEIIKTIKKNCTYYDIVEINTSEYVCYSCPESKYKGKIGFMINDKSGYITHFANH